MGVSTDGKICFGVDFDEDFEFPWNSEDDEIEIDDWWRDLHNYVNPYQIWTDDGNLKEDITPEDKRKYYDYRHQWIEDNPVPFELVNTCSCDYPIYMLAMPKTNVNCSRGYPTEIDLNMFNLVTQDVDKFKTALKKYGLYISEPKWYLSSLWC